MDYETYFYVILFFKDLFLEREKGGEKEREGNIDARNINWLPLAGAPTRENTHNPGMCPGQESQRPVVLWDNTQPTEPHQSGFYVTLFMNKCY